MKAKQIAGDFLNINRCVGELTILYAREVVQRIGQTVCDAMDVFGEDPLEDQELRSGIFEEREAA